MAIYLVDLRSAAAGGEVTRKAITMLRRTQASLEAMLERTRA